MGHFFAQIKLVVHEIYSQNSAMIKYSCNLQCVYTTCWRWQLILYLQLGIFYDYY